MADAVTALSARERVDVCALPDELQLHLLWQLPELGGIGFPRGCWAACSLVCRRWRAILADQRSQCRCRAGDPQLLPSALRALTASKRPIVSLAVDRVEEAADGDLSAVSRLAASSSLRALALLFHGRYTQLSRLVLEPLAAALTAAPCSLTSLDLTSRGAHVSERLLSALVQGAPNLECLLLEGCVVDAEPAPDPDPDAAPLGPMSPLLRLAPRLRSLSLATSPVGTGPLAPQPGFPTPRTETLWSRFVRLESLDLSRVKLRRSEVDALTSKPGVADTLVALTLAGHTGLAPVGLASVVACCGQLRKVDLSGSFFADISFDCMMDERMRALETVSLVDCSAVGDEGVTALCKARTPAGQLRELALGGPFARLSDASLAAIGACGTLRRLVLQMGGARNGFSDDGFRALAVGAGCNLEALEIVELSDLAESSLRLLLPRSGPGCGAALRRLVLRGCELAVTDAVLGASRTRAAARKPRRALPAMRPAADARLGARRQRVSRRGRHRWLLATRTRPGGPRRL